ncbi:MAG: diguanylate cyclase [Gallionellaceae bacterium]|jgi:diguanylate cyclase (GGDEF)-like protein/PAS domain S-box-containing protein
MMNRITNKWHGLGVQEKLHILIQGSLIILFFISMEWVIGRFEEQIMTSAEVRAEETADGLINGMNMLMLTGTISNPDNRKLLLSKMQQSEGIKELRIVRGKSVNAQFGNGLPEEQARDDMEREVLETGKVQFKRIDVPHGPPLLRVVVPFIALENFRGTNCMSCHVAEVGSVNGAASVVIDLSKDEESLQNIKNWLWAGHIAIQILLSIIISWFVRVLIVKNIAEPVKKLQAAMSEIQRENNLSKRADVDENNPDIGEMARTFNALVGNLEHATDRLELFGKMFHGSGEAMLITDANKNIMAVNPAFTEITGYAAEEVIGKDPNVLCSGKQTPDFYQTMWVSLNEAGQWQGEIWNRRKSGEIYPEWLSIGVVKNSKGEVINYISLFSDITERKVAEQKIEFLAHYDSLTRLPNRALFSDRLKLALVTAGRYEKRVGLLFLDLDKFKAINDSLGHLAGDLLLKSVAERLKSCVRESDTVCRQGGDEFMILLPDAGTRDDVENVAKKIILAMAETHQIEGQELLITFSVGISIYPDNAKDSEAMIKCADDAMYRAKELGRNNYQFF